jgi:hypothetical protein
MNICFARVGEFTVRRAKELGEEAGIAAAIRCCYDSASFEDEPNPFGIDSEADFHEAWQDAYENEFELNK